MLYATLKSISDDIELIRALDAFNKKLQSAKEEPGDKEYFKIDNSLMLPYGDYGLLVENEILQMDEVAQTAAGIDRWFAHALIVDDDEVEIVQIGKKLQTPELKTKGDVEVRMLDQFEKIKIYPSQIIDAVNELGVPLIKRLSYTEMLLRLLNRRIYINRDNSGRLFTNLSNLKGDLKYLLMPLNFVELDLKNSQILLLYACGYKNQNWKRLAEAGILYEQMATVCGLTRKEAKDAIIPILMCHPDQHNKNLKVYNAVQQQFPDLIDFLCDQKKRYYKDMSLSLQKGESRIFVDLVLKTLLPIPAKPATYSG